ncbi:putative capsid protein [uncultured virus]|uniref:Putative capsid protein n=1 Tax=uncultured virus TaxID=340016 RepID=A0A1I9XGD4_9VIRU|nr:putative capsid protein [uncultured virus]
MQCSLLAQKYNLFLKYMANGRKQGNVRRGARSYRPSAKGSSKGLTKTEKKQVSTIAKKAVTSMAESKYFNVREVSPEVVNAAWKISTDYSDVGVWGYTTGYNRQTNQSDQQKIMRYGVSTVDGTEISMTNLRMNRVFLNDDTNEALRAFAIEGQTLRPAFNECQWFLNHVAQSTDLDAMKGLQYRLRCVRVTPRAIKGSFQDIDPEQDLFLNQYNQAFGIASTDAVGTSALEHQHYIHLAKVNSRKYKVHQDKFYTVAPAAMYAEVSAGASGAYLVTDNAPGCMTMTTTHNIGKELFYPIPNREDANEMYPTSGFVPEFILWHVIALGDNETASAARATPLGMTIAPRPVSTFKDF